MPTSGWKVRPYSNSMKRIPTHRNRCRWQTIFGGKGYYPLITENLEEGVFTSPEQDYALPDAARHGTPISITAAEYNALMNALW